MIRPVLTAVCAFFVIALAPASATAQDTQASTDTADERSAIEKRAEQVIALVNGEVEPEEVFTDGFLAAVPPAQFKTITGQLTSQFGAAVSVEKLDPPSGTRSTLHIRMERAIAKGGIAIDPSADNLVSELLFRSFEPTSDSLDKIEADLKGLPGKATWWFGPLDGDAPAIASSGTDEQMPIGSTFKLTVLAILAKEIREGKRKWSDHITLSDNRSFPSGMMQDWPDGSPVTLHTLASLMISISDNTATDTLIDELGRDAIMQMMIETGHSAPELNDPFLKTREMFLLKAGPEGRLRAYLRGNADVRRQILDGIEDIPLSQNEVEAAFSGPPIALDVEWFASALDIANLMRHFRQEGDQETLAILAISPSIPLDLQEKWSYVGYKGGSEPGVLNLSWLLRDNKGQDYALILSQRHDDARFDPTTLELIAQRLLSLER